jgi:protein farnesyltransferase subunit beta
MHDMGELDMRGTYCAIAVASMLHILSDEMIEGVADYVATCQQWDGALPGEAGLESHGGYTYCGLAALCILGEEHKLDLEALLDWLVHRQMTAEGGFQGRTNKLVDSCYTFWQGAIANLLHNSMGDRAPADHMWISSVPLQMYVLLACQSVQGGLRDKPGKSPDYYHTCYSLSGVAASQAKGDLCGSPENMLVPTSVYYNCSEGKAREARRYFADHPITVGGQTGREGAGVVLHEETRRSDPVPPTRPPAVAGRGYPS